MIQRKSDRRKVDRRECTRCYTGEHPDPCYDCLRKEIVGLRSQIEMDRADAETAINAYKAQIEELKGGNDEV